MSKEPSWQRIETQRPKPARVLVLGSSGMVGRAWCELLKRKNITFTPLHRPDFDLTDERSIDLAFTQPYNLVVNAAAWTDVDGAESDESGAIRANSAAVKQIAQRCASIGGLLITYSTDYIFDGRSSKPYKFDHSISPINAYGRSKAQGEQEIRAQGDRHLIIRTSWVHAPWGNNFVLTMRNLMQDRKVLRVVDDQHGRPSSALSIASGSLKLYTHGALGTWHLTDAGECTWYGLATHVRDSIRSSCAVEPCTSDEFPRPAPRPPYSTLDISATESLIGAAPSWQSMTKETLKQAEAAQRAE